ncbi:hypothetical protein FPQ18DRAFT_323522 [Pyronema domesticum]|nr:hypothetical protein FPQ18DRAFT_323522 [Pyronema domesticum]
MLPNIATVLLFLVTSLAPAVHAVPPTMNYDSHGHARVDFRELRKHAASSWSEFFGLHKVKVHLTGFSEDIKTFVVPVDKDDIACQDNCAWMYDVGGLQWMECRRCCRGRGNGGDCAGEEWVVMGKEL